MGANMLTMDKFKTVWVGLDPNEKRELARQMETSVAYLSQIAHGHARAGKHFTRILVAEIDRIPSKTRRETGNGRST